MLESHETMWMGLGFSMLFWLPGNDDVAQRCRMNRMIGDDAMASMGSDNSEIIDAAFALAEADWVLVASGAGLSADSGLDTYEGLRDQGVDYDILCRAELLYDKPALFHSFWLGSLLKYRGTAPHEGFQILENLLRERADMGRVYLYTSNVDGHLRHWGITSCSFMSFDSLFPWVPPAPQKKHWIHKASMFVCQPRTAAGFSFV